MSNPYEVLQLDPSATEAEIIEQAGKLRQRSTEEKTLTAVRQAVQQLTASSEQREVLALLSHPQPMYRWPAMERLLNANRRVPSSTSDEEKTSPPLDMDLIAKMLRALLAEELRPTALNYVQPRIDELPQEIDQQTINALCQALLYDTQT